MTASDRLSTVRHADPMPTMGRRRILTMGAALGVVGLAGGLTGGLAQPALGAVTAPERRLWLVNTWTGEQFQRPYWIQGRYLVESLKDVTWLLRDHLNAKTCPVDPMLLDTLHALCGRVGTGEPLQVISGYRSPETNAAARRKSRRVAVNSQHLRGKAIDIRVKGAGLASLRQAALSLKAGGVGYYPRSNYLHLDTGPVRSW